MNNKICPKCGKESTPGLNICNNCGSYINNENTNNNLDIFSMPGQENQQPSVVNTDNNVQPQTTISTQPVADQPAVPVAPVIQAEPTTPVQPIQPTVTPVSSQPVNPVNVFPQPVDAQPSNNGSSITKYIIIAVIAIGLIIGGIFGAKSIFGTKKTGDAKVDNLLKGSLIRVKVDGLYGYVDTNGKMVIQPQFYSATDFFGNYAAVTMPDSPSNERFIDRNGNIKDGLIVFGSKYYENHDRWIIDNKLYDGDLKLLSDEDALVSPAYDNDQYLRFKKSTNKKAGLMDYNGNILYSVTTDDEYHVDVMVSNKTMKEVTQYAAIANDNEIKFLNLETLKVVKTMDYSRFDCVLSDNNNVFTLCYKEDDLEYPDYWTYIYVRDDDTFIQTDPYEYSGHIDADMWNNGIVTIHNYAKDETKYMDYCTKEIHDTYNFSTSCKLTRIDTETFEDYSEYKIDNYAIKKGEQEIIEKGKYTEYKTLPKTLYKYLKALNKDYIIAYGDKRYHVIDLTKGESVYDFEEGSYVSLNDDSTFISIKKQGDTDYKYFSLITLKQSDLVDSSNSYEYIDYIKKNNSDTYEYYNANFELFYTEKK